MPTTPKQFGFIRTTIALWAANVGSFIRAGVVSDSPNGGNAWGVNVPGFGWLYAAMRGAHESFASVAATSLTDGKYPKAGTGGELGDGALSEDASSVKSAKPLTLNGATRPAWGGAFLGATQLTNEVALATYVAVGPHAYQAWANVYYDGTNYRAVSTYSGQGFPTILGVFNGGLDLSSSVSNPVAGGVISDMLSKWSVDKTGAMTVAGGLGVFGVTPPTTRPTVNTACTDLATAIALTNQLRTHLIACGLVQ